ncbi:hypothetical protein [Bacillus subtilis]|uniref:hypothetical protein n=1 Tax=Bacillus subtilis TaxID=1423 RepID=UPI00164A57F7|nr:hypothetical protein [Bacillus subtilis]
MDVLLSAFLVVDFLDSVAFFFVSALAFALSAFDLLSLIDLLGLEVLLLLLDDLLLLLLLEPNHPPELLLELLLLELLLL